MRRTVLPLAERDRVARAELAGVCWCSSTASTPEPGRVPLLTANTEDSFLFELVPGLREGRVPIGQRAQSALQRAGALALQYLPIRRSGDPDWGIRFITSASDQSVQPESIDGESLGLSFFLAWVSWHLQLPVPRGIVATAALQSDGSIEPVQMLSEKAGLVRAVMPGARLHVSPHQTAALDLEVDRLPNLLQHVERHFGDLGQLIDRQDVSSRCGQRPLT